MSEEDNYDFVPSPPAGSAEIQEHELRPALLEMMHAFVCHPSLEEIERAKEENSPGGSNGMIFVISVHATVGVCIGLGDTGQYIMDRLLEKGWDEDVVKSCFEEVIEEEMMKYFMFKHAVSGSSNVHIAKVNEDGTINLPAVDVDLEALLDGE